MNVVLYMVIHSSSNPLALLYIVARICVIRVIVKLIQNKRAFWCCVLYLFHTLFSSVLFIQLLIFVVAGLWSEIEGKVLVATNSFSLNPVTYLERDFRALFSTTITAFFFSEFPCNPHIMLFIPVIDI